VRYIKSVLLVLSVSSHKSFIIIFSTIVRPTVKYVIFWRHIHRAHTGHQPPPPWLSGTSIALRYSRSCAAPTMYTTNIVHIT